MYKILAILVTVLIQNYGIASSNDEFFQGDQEGDKKEVMILENLTIGETSIGNNWQGVVSLLEDLEEKKRGPNFERLHRSQAEYFSAYVKNLLVVLETPQVGLESCSFQEFILGQIETLTLEHASAKNEHDTFQRYILSEYDFWFQLKETEDDVKMAELRSCLKCKECSLNFARLLQDVVSNNQSIQPQSIISGLKEVQGRLKVLVGDVGSDAKGGL